MKQPLKETQDPKDYMHIYRVMGCLGADTKHKKKMRGKKMRVAPGNRQSRRASSKSKKTSLPKAKGFGK
jgi:hypothetical protein